MSKTLTYTIEDNGPNCIVYETEVGQRATVANEGGVPVIYLNRRACVFLSKLFAQLGEGNMLDGFHLHLGQDLDPEGEEAVRIVLHENFK